MQTHPSTSKLPESSDQEQAPSKTEWDELAELAAMTGYNTEVPSPTKDRSPVVRQTATSTDEDETDSPLLDEEDLETNEPSKKTQTPLWGNPMAKSGFVMVLMAIALGFIGLVISSFNRGSDKTSVRPNSSAAAQSTAPIDPEQTEIGRLKAINALGNQVQTLSQPAKPTGVPVRPTVTRTQPARTAPVVRSAAPSYNPPPRYTPPLRTAPIAAPVPPVLPVSTARVTPESIDPAQAWQEALKAGSFGEGREMAIAPSSPALPSEPGTATVQENMVAQSPDSRYEADAAALLSGIPRRVATVNPGAAATATLTTPVVWAQDLKPNQQPQRFVLQLTQPLYAVDGSIALPVGTQMIARVDAISESGLVQLSIVHAVTLTQQGNQMMELPPGALLISGEGGKPLMAENHNPEKARIAGMDLNVALLGALGQVGTLLNRPSNQTTMTSPYLSTTSVSNSETNIVGGLLQGAFNPLMEQMQDRQKDEIAQILKRPNLWYVPAGQMLQVFTNSLFEVPR